MKLGLVRVAEVAKGFHPLPLGDLLGAALLAGPDGPPPRHAGEGVVPLDGGNDTAGEAALSLPPEASFALNPSESRGVHRSPACSLWLMAVPPLPSSCEGCVWSGAFVPKAYNAALTHLSLKRLRLRLQERTQKNTTTNSSSNANGNGETLFPSGLWP